MQPIHIPGSGPHISSWDFAPSKGGASDKDERSILASVEGVELGGIEPSHTRSGCSIALMLGPSSTVLDVSGLTAADQESWPRSELKGHYLGLVFVICLGGNDLERS